jgi:hypothetical protein
LLSAALKQWRLTVLWRRTIGEFIIVGMGVDMDGTAAKSVVVDTTAYLRGQSEQPRVGSVGGGATIDSISNLNMALQIEG